MPYGKQEVFPLDNREITIGRDPTCNVVLKGIGISGCHARIVCDHNGPQVNDNGSSFGTMVNGRSVSECILRDGDTLTVGVFDFQIGISDNELVLFPAEDVLHPETAVTKPAKKKETISIGRDTANDIHLSHPLISRQHCTVSEISPGIFSIRDHGSANGTFLNGRRISQAKLSDGDIVQVGPYRFMIDNGEFILADDYHRIKLVASDITVRRGSVKLIDSVSLSIQPGEFVAILGPSGAGKTTLAHALTGLVPVSGGEVYYNGLPLKMFNAAFSSSIGFVSQKNILRHELTVWETFFEQSILRLPGDSMNSERTERIYEVMEMLEISHLSGRRISRLSGGEAKRIHLGIELLSSPTIIFLDEPLAGLDPGLTAKFMELFRSISDKGHTLLLATHTLEQIGLCSRVIFISKGRMVFEGIPEEVSTRLGVNSLAEVYEKVRNDTSFLRKTQMVMEESKRNEEKTEGTEGEKPQISPYIPRRKTVNKFRQIAVLIVRYGKILVRDYTNIFLIFSQAPLIAMLMGFVFETSGSFIPLSFYFCMTIASVWMGGINSVREVAREWNNLDREFRIGLSVSAFLLAKIFVFGVLGIFQALVFGWFVDMLFSGFRFDIPVAVITASASVSGVILGLCISAFSGNINRAVSWLPIIFIPQIFFSGILMPFDRMPDIGRWISYLTVSRPVFSMFKKVCVLEKGMSSLNEWKALLLLNCILIILMFLRIRWYRNVSHQL